MSRLYIPVAIRQLMPGSLGPAVRLSLAAVSASRDHIRHI